MSGFGANLSCGLTSRSELAAAASAATSSFLLYSSVAWNAGVNISESSTSNYCSCSWKLHCHRVDSRPRLIFLVDPNIGVWTSWSEVRMALFKNIHPWALANLPLLGVHMVHHDVPLARAKYFACRRVIALRSTELHPQESAHKSPLKDEWSK